MQKNLFSEFDEISAKQWKQKIQFDLKGADYNEKLVWQSLDGVHVKPFYHPDDSLEPMSIPSPGQWNVVEQIYVSTADRGAKRASEALKKGAESLWFIIPSEEISLDELFKDLDLKQVTVYLKPEILSQSFLDQTKILSSKAAAIHVQTDILGNLARSGNWFHDQEKDHQLLKSALLDLKSFSSLISIDLSLYQNAGATIPQQLAYAMAHLNEYLNYSSKLEDFPVEEKQNFQFQFVVAVGPNYFFEIAKIRALRMLLATLTREYGFSEECHILAQPSKRNKTLYDYNVNLLRTTTECMSAILGGANGICNMAYDALYHKNNSFGTRIARNQLLILKHESYFEKVSNPAEGSYYIETLTHQLADKALDLFKDIEKGGGFLNQLKEGTIQKKIAESAEKEQKQFDSGELVLIGTNKYPNPEDKMKKDLELYPFLKVKPRKTLLQPILEKRLAEQSEQKRLKKEEE